MSKRKIQQPPQRTPNAGFNQPTVHVLDQFTEANLERWRALSADLDELHRVLYFQVQPQRLRRKQELVDALNSRNQKAFEFGGWVRVVDYRYANSPLSAEGSLRGVGGRFNVGPDVDESINKPFPALYVGDSFETAYRERFQLASAELPVGLTPEEMALTRSTANVLVRGKIERCIDVSDRQNLVAVCKVLARIRKPDAAIGLMRRLKLGPKHVFMITSPSQLASALQEQNWRARPTQFGIPSVSQQFAELARAAGYEGIVYQSSKRPDGKCLALFTDSIGSDRTFIELSDAYPASVIQHRVDIDSPSP